MKGEPRRGGGRQDVIDLLSRRYRLWAVLPADVDALIALGPPGSNPSDGGMVAVVPRPPFPPGVCRSCGCQEDDPCLTGRGPCAWADDDRTLCTACETPAELLRAVRASTRAKARRTSRGPKQRRLARR